MESTTIKFGAGGNSNITSRMPSFVSQTSASNPMGREANEIQSSRVLDFGGLEQYLGFQVGDSTNVGRSSVYNTTLPNSQTAGPDLPSNTYNKNIAPTIPNFFASVAGSQAMQLGKGPHPNIVSPSGAQHENWAESNMADSSSHTNTSADMDPDDKNQRVNCLYM